MAQIDLVANFLGRGSQLYIDGDIDSGNLIPGVGDYSPSGATPPQTDSESWGETVTLTGQAPPPDLVYNVTRMVPWHRQFNRLNALAASGSPASFTWYGRPLFRPMATSEIPTGVKIEIPMITGADAGKIGIADDDAADTMKTWLSNNARVGFAFVTANDTYMIDQMRDRTVSSLDIRIFPYPSAAIAAGSGEAITGIISPRPRIPTFQATVSVPPKLTANVPSGQTAVNASFTIVPVGQLPDFDFVTS